MSKNKRVVSVDHLEKLANLKVAPQEKKKIGPQLEKTIDYFTVLEQIPNLNQEKPTFQVTNNINIVAKDKTGPCLPKQKILGQKNYFTSSR